MQLISTYVDLKTKFNFNLKLLESNIQALLSLVVTSQLYHSLYQYLLLFPIMAVKSTEKNGTK